METSKTFPSAYSEKTQASPLKLWKNLPPVPEQEPPSITPFLLPGRKLRPAVLVIPGGGYCCVCESIEGTPVARRFNELGYHAFVLNYRCRTERFSKPQQDALRAMKIIRGNARKWHIIPDRICACGFSAGGHLAACLGTIAGEIDASDGDEFDAVNGIPDALFLSYPVIVLEPWSHADSGKFLFGPDYRKYSRKYSLHRRVTAQTPPVFLWHTVRDQVVSFRNSVYFADALAEAGVPCSLHLYPYGDHGMLLGLDTQDVFKWTQAAVDFEEVQRLRKQAEKQGKQDAFRQLYTHPEQARLEKCRAPR